MCDTLKTTLGRKQAQFAPVFLQFEIILLVLNVVFRHFKFHDN